MTEESHAPPTGCEYETDAGGACPNRARFKLTFKDERAPAGLTGEPVRYMAHACHGHYARIKCEGTAGGIVLEKEESL